MPGCHGDDGVARGRAGRGSGRCGSPRRPRPAVPAPWAATVAHPPGNRPRSAEQREQGYFLVWPSPTCSSSSPRSNVEGDLARVRAPVDPHLEVTGIVAAGAARAAARRCCSSGPTRGAMPLLINVFGTERRMAMALGVDRLDEIGDRIADLLKPELPHGHRRLAGRARQGRRSCARCRRGRSKSAPVPGGGPARRRGRPATCCPASRPGPSDGGVFLNLGLTHTKHPETGARNLGMYRLQQQDDADGQPALADPQGLHRRTPRSPSGAASGCRWRSRSAARPRSPTRRRAPLPADIDEYLFAGFLQRERVDLVDCVDRCRCRCRPHAQVVLEGWVEPGERLPEGPFGDHTGFYTPVEPFPFVRVETMTMRSDADLPVDHRRPAAAGGRPARQGHRADLPAADPADRAGDRRLRPARGRACSTTAASSRSTSASRSTRRR